MHELELRFYQTSLFLDCQQPPPRATRGHARNEGEEKEIGCCAQGDTTQQHNNNGIETFMHARTIAQTPTFHFNPKPRNVSYFSIRIIAARGEVANRIGRLQKTSNLRRQLPNEIKHITGQPLTKNRLTNSKSSQQTACYVSTS